MQNRSRLRRFLQHVDGSEGILAAPISPLVELKNHFAITSGSPAHRESSQTWSSPSSALPVSKAAKLLGGERLRK